MRVTRVSVRCGLCSVGDAPPPPAPSVSSPRHRLDWPERETFPGGSLRGLEEDKFMS